MAADTMAGNERKRALRAPEAELENFILSLHRLSNVIAESSALNKNSIGISEWAVLSVLDRDKNINLRDLLRQSGVSRQRIRKILQVLEDKKMLTVSQIDEGDKRQRTVIATPKGIRTHQTILQSLGQLLDGLAGSSTSPDIERDRLARRLRIAERLSTRLTKAMKPRHKQAETFWPSKHRQ